MQNLEQEFIRIGAKTFVLVQAVNGRHILRRKLEIEDVGIFADTMLLHRFRNDDDAVLNIPAQNDLRRGFPYFSAICARTG